MEHTYTYPAAGQQRPHTVTEVKTTADGGARTAFTYDQAGFTTAVERNGAVDVLDWTPTGRVETVTSGEETTTFIDDADGKRILRIDPDGDTTAWVAGYELTHHAATRTVQASRYYRHGGDTVGVRIGRGDIQWFAADHHGTNQWIVNATPSPPRHGVSTRSATSVDPRRRAGRTSGRSSAGSTTGTRS